MKPWHCWPLAVCQPQPLSPNVVWLELPVLLLSEAEVQRRVVAEEPQPALEGLAWSPWPLLTPIRAALAGPQIDAPASHWPGPCRPDYKSDILP